MLALPRGEISELELAKIEIKSLVKHPSLAIEACGDEEKFRAGFAVVARMAL